MPVFDPKNPQMSSINLGARISKPLRSILNTGSRMMSNNKFIKSMRAQMSESGKMSDKLARKVSIRAAAGVKELGLESGRQKKAFAEGMQEEGMLGVPFHKNPKLALKAYERAAEANSAAAHAHVEHLEALHPEHGNLGHDGEEDPRAQAGHRHETHDRMQKIRDQIEADKKQKQAKEVSVTQKIRADEQAAVTVSIAHVDTTKPAEEVLESHTTHVGPGGRDNAAGSINQLLDKKPVNDNQEEEISFGGPIGAANDNEEQDLSAFKKVA